MSNLNLKTLIVCLILTAQHANAALTVECPVGRSPYMTYTGLIEFDWSLSDTLFRDGLYTELEAAVTYDPLTRAHSYFVAPFTLIGSDGGLEYSVRATAPAPIEYSATSNIYVMRIYPGWPTGYPELLRGNGVSDYCENVVDVIP